MKNYVAILFLLFLSVIPAVGFSQKMGKDGWPAAPKVMVNGSSYALQVNKREDANGKFLTYKTLEEIVGKATKIREQWQELGKLYDIYETSKGKQFIVIPYGKGFIKKTLRIALKNEERVNITAPLIIDTGR